ncbi:DUF1456 family protein [Flavobacterium oreochromis]|uniref:DUF1456 family protein n=1 Tax=Flavobacterium oreochromis TaxID=2906078 RepID=A0ABW8P6J2_9FLAO|nr:DUF1456 family protein [Flavobacterium oreochromis]OWP76605.1 hypothetical protein BWG23_07525 [Flavobacterium oreochromis]QYS85716.1 DUF1456 family protein [Flavobacterium oreochromis]
MTNNDIFKKLRVALQLRDDQIVEILELVDFRASKAELGNIFRNEDHPKYMECGDQILRNFLNGLIIYLRGSKETPKNPLDVLNINKQNIEKFQSEKKQIEKKTVNKTLKPADKQPYFKKNTKNSNPIFEPVRFKNGKKKD